MNLAVEAVESKSLRSMNTKNTRDRSRLTQEKQQNTPKHTHTHAHCCKIFFSHSQLSGRIRRTCLRVRVRKDDTEYQRLLFQKIVARHGSQNRPEEVKLNQT